MATLHVHEPKKSCAAERKLWSASRTKGLSMRREQLPALVLPSPGSRGAPSAGRKGYAIEKSKEGKALHRDRAIIERQGGARQCYRRRPAEVGRIVLARELAP